MFNKLIIKVICPISYEVDDEDDEGHSFIIFNSKKIL